jgi:hypothetical protein
MNHFKFITFLVLVIGITSSVAINNSILNKKKNAEINTNEISNYLEIKNFSNESTKRANDETEKEVINLTAVSIESTTEISSKNKAITPEFTEPSTKETSSDENPSMEVTTEKPSTEDFTSKFSTPEPDSTIEMSSTKEEILTTEATTITKENTTTEETTTTTEETTTSTEPTESE